MHWRQHSGESQEGGWTLEARRQHLSLKGRVQGSQRMEEGGEEAEKELFCPDGLDEWARWHLVRIPETLDCPLARVFCIDSPGPFSQAIGSFQPRGFTFHRLGRNDWLDIIKMK